MSDGKTLHIDIRVPLDNFTLELSKTLSHPVTGFFGPSGSGKTTLLQVLAGWNQQVTGRIALGEQVWLDSSRGVNLPTQQRGVGYVTQASLLFPNRTVRQNLLFSTRASASLEWFDRLVAALDLPSLLDRKPVLLSGGERQRVALGRALCSQPKLLLLDEPLSALDAKLRYSLLLFLKQVRLELDVPTIWVSHDTIEMQALCDEVIVLREGKSLTCGAPRTVLTDPQHFPAFDQAGFQNVFPCRVTETNERETTVWLKSDYQDKQPLHLTIANPASAPVVGSQGLVSVPARSILIATERPAGISARNVLQGTIVNQRTASGLALLSIMLRGDVPLLTVEVTLAACEQLSIRQNGTVFVLIKSTACQLLGAR